MINFLHNFIPNPILLEAGFISLHWYGLFVVSGILATLLVTVELAKKFNISSDKVYNAGFYIIIFGLIGARVYSVFLDLPYYLQNPLHIFAVWQGGLAIHGGLIGAGLAIWLITKKSNSSFWTWADIAVPGAALGQAIGRWGNYFNQEIFGTPTDRSWGIPIDMANRPAQYLSSQYFHPTFLYESILNIINFVILLLLFKLLLNKDYKLKTGSGIIFLIYLINYSIIRFSMEFLRTDVMPEFFGLRVSALVSLVIIIGSLGVLILRLKKRQG